MGKARLHRQAGGAAAEQQRAAVTLRDREAKHHAIRDAAFSTLGQRLSLATKPADAARIIADVSSSLLGWEACALDLYDDEKGQMFPLLNIDTVNGLRAEVEPRRIGTPPTLRQRRIMEQGPELILRHEPIEMPADAVPFGDTERASASLLLARIRNATRVIGLLSIHSYEVDAYTQEDLRTLQALADFCGGALERIRAAEALRQTEARYRCIFENAIEGLAQVTPDGRFLTANPALARMLGYASPEELIASVTDIGRQLYVDPGWRTTLAGVLKEQGFIRAYEAQVYRKDRAVIWVSISSQVTRDEEGRILHFESVIEDITERKRVNAEIEKLAAFPRLNPNPVLQFNAEGTLVYFNEAARKLAESIGHESPTEVWPQDTALIVRECLRTGQSRFHLETKAGDRTVSWSFFPIAESRVVHCYAADITDRLRLEAELRHVQKLESIGQLAAGVAHDFNNLLTIIQGYTSLLQTNDSSMVDPKEALAQIATASQRGADLTRQLLAFSRRQPMRPVRLDVNETVRNVSSLLQRVIREDVTLSYAFGPGLPQIEADASMMEQIIMNLAVNARDAMPHGGTLSISTQGVDVDERYVDGHAEAATGRYVCLTVSDTGVGMSAGTLSRIFEPFFTTKDVGKGTGLGLAAVYGIVKQHHGWIEVASAVGRGSIFKVFLPAITTLPVEDAAERPTTPGRHGTGETLLLVEDEPALRVLARRVLQAYGYRVVDAGSGVEALAVWEKHSSEIKLLLTDMVMPGGVTGRELAEKLKARNAGLKVIFISGYSSETVAEGLELTEGVDFLAKPYHPSALAKIVRSCLGGQDSNGEEPATA